VSMHPALMIRQGRTLRTRADVRRQIDVKTSNFKCDDRNHAREFVAELMEIQDKTRHCARIRVEDCDVVLETWTPNVGITELDDEFAAAAKDAYEQFRRQIRR
jgi:pterin-4a-carbinolamine dehydratase